MSYKSIKERVNKANNDFATLVLNTNVDVIKLLSENYWQRISFETALSSKHVVFTVFNKDYQPDNEDTFLQEKDKEEIKRKFRDYLDLPEDTTVRLNIKGYIEVILDHY